MKAVSTALLAAAALALAGPACAQAGAAAPPSTRAHSAAPVGACTLPAGRSTLTVTSGGVQRTALVQRPADTGPRDALPVVLTLHGSQSTAEQQMAVSGMAEAADEHGFLAVAPQGLIELPPGYRWNVPYVTGPGGPDDEQFLTDLLDTLGRTGCADTGRVLATGLSGGGRMVSQYACDHPDKVTAIAATGGLRAGAPSLRSDGGYAPDPATCTPGKPVPVLTFHGDADPVNPYPGGGMPYWGYGVEAALRTWAELDGCQHGPRTTEVTTHVDKTAYEGCRAGADVEMYVVHGGGHTWPGSTAYSPPELGSITDEIDATEVMWDFFRTQDRAASTASR